MLIKVPVSWLREYVDIDIPIDDLALKLHMYSTEVKGVERPWWEKIWVGRVEELRKHPDADKLWLATVHYREVRPKIVVTAAANLAKSAVVPVAKAGGQLIHPHAGARARAPPEEASERAGRAH